MRGEEELLRKITAAFPSFSRGTGIGDDAAVIDIPGPVVVTADLLIEGVDFTESIPAGFIAVKSLAVNLSDLAAMGAKPAVFFLSLGIPERWLGRFDRFVSALAASAARHHIELAGGDLSAARDFTIAITAHGTLDGGRGALLRSAARPGHRIFVSRPLGASAAGLDLLSRGWTIDENEIVHEPETVRIDYIQRDVAGSVIRRHVAPEAEVALGNQLRTTTGVGGCIDISDGLSTDLHRLCAASGVGAVIEWEKIPSLPDLDRTGPSLGINVPQCVLHGGEEYSLLFTAALNEAEASRIFGRPVYAIGRITEEREVLLERGGMRAPLEPGGFDHFRMMNVE